MKTNKKRKQVTSANRRLATSLVTTSLGDKLKRIYICGDSRKRYLNSTAGSKRSDVTGNIIRQLNPTVCNVIGGRSTDGLFDIDCNGSASINICAGGQPFAPTFRKLSQTDNHATQTVTIDETTN